MSKAFARVTSAGPRGGWRAWVLVVLAFGLGAGCSGSGGNGGHDSRVGTLSIVSGNQQSAAAEAQLPKPIQIRVVGNDGLVAPNVTVQFDTLEGRGTFESQFVVSDAKGIASVRYNLGRLPVTNRMRATITGSSVDLEARALNVNPPVPKQRIDQLPLPESLAFDNAGHLIVSSQLNGSLVEVRPGPFKFSDEFVFDYRYRGKTNSSLTGIAYDHAGILYACDNRTGSIARFDGSNEPTVFLEGYQFDPFSLPNGIAVSPRSNDIYFSDTERNRIYKVGPEGRDLSIASEAVPQPNGLAFSADGDILYVTSLSPGGVFALPVSGGGGLGAASKIAELPTGDGIALDADGNIYAIGTEVGKLTSGIYLIPADGSPAFRYITAPSPKIYANLAFGRTGFNTTSIYVVSLNGTIDEVDVGVPGLELPGPVAQSGG